MEQVIDSEISPICESNGDDSKTMEKVEDTEIKVKQSDKAPELPEHINDEELNCGHNTNDAFDSSKVKETSSKEMNVVIADEQKSMENTEKDAINCTKVATFEFDWMTYFESQNKDLNNKAGQNASVSISPVPNHVFAHVEASLDGGVREGMIVEMPYEEKATRKRESNQQFWLAKVEAVYGPLLKLTYVGCNETKPEIWHDLTQKRLFPLGNVKYV